MCATGGNIQRKVVFLRKKISRGSVRSSFGELFKNAVDGAVLEAANIDERPARVFFIAKQEVTKRDPHGVRLLGRAARLAHLLIDAFDSPPRCLFIGVSLLHGLAYVNVIHIVCPHLEGLPLING